MGSIHSTGPRKASQSFSLAMKGTVHSCVLSVLQIQLGCLYVLFGSSVTHKHSLISVYDCMSVESFRQLSSKVLIFGQEDSTFNILNIGLRH